MRPVFSVFGLLVFFLLDDMPVFVVAVVVVVVVALALNASIPLRRSARLMQTDWLFSVVGDQLSGPTTWTYWA
eukprot:CAMPEP_0206551400 /NCGR_PEP_ID=MMETSP0325_2-20121206/15510_1 /ASSEMBLY_ACC=CAM_ASM_000347 /TAXON_ID=2866 /ORGANISM="Crypthecodinium cohnii, Strain Seligo" /LENGTH=72 /DNA_ID=CAMNT_0054051171 /DNA_START=154 /DNA_END=368 /DNA_ORIENTATION=+